MTEYLIGLWFCRIGLVCCVAVGAIIAWGVVTDKNDGTWP